MTDDPFERRYGWWLRSKRRTRVAMAFYWLIPVSFLAISIVGINETMFRLPHAYAALEQRGVRVTAQFAGCTGGRDRTCSLRLPGSAARWKYGENQPQFDGLEYGDPVTVLVDPRDPNRRYTALDVRQRTHEGPGGLFVLSVIFGLAGLVAVRFVWRFQRGMLRIADDRAARPR